MNIRPIFSALMRNKTGPLLLMLQVAVTLAVLTNAFYIVHDKITHMQRPAGIDVSNQFRVSVRGYGENYWPSAEIQADLEAIRAIDGVLAVTPINAVPLGESGWSGTIRASEDVNGPSVNMALYMANEDSLDALGVRLVAGRGFQSDEISELVPQAAVPPSPVVISQAVAERLFPDGDALGNTIYSPGDEVHHRVVGIVEHLVRPWASSSHFEMSYLLPLVLTAPVTQYLIRTRPGMRDEVMAQVETVLADRVDERLVGTVNTMEATVARAYENHRAMSIIMIAVSILLLIVNALGIVGLASFQINRRRRQIGTRRALGATRGAIMGHFMIESGLIVAVGLIVGLVLAVTLNFGLMSWLEFRRMELTWLPAAALVLFVLGQFAVLGPARRAAAVPPAVATRSV